MDTAKRTQWVYGESLLVVGIGATRGIARVGCRTMSHGKGLSTREASGRIEIQRTAGEVMLRALTCRFLPLAAAVGRSRNARPGSGGTPSCLVTRSERPARVWP